MTDENKKPQVAPEVPEVSEDELSGANGGFSLSPDSLYRYVHKDCGGGIERKSIVGLPIGWWCSDCLEHHDSLEEFDYYSVLPKQPMF